MTVGERESLGPPEPAPDVRQVAALDLGSNSFHLILCRPTADGLLVLERRREQVQLRAGLDEEGYLDEAARIRALSAIRRLAQLVRPRPGLVVRVAATNTFRTARNAAPLREELEAELGHPVEVIDAEEEARLIYLGVAHTTPTGSRPAVVFDIGGGSTECILGCNGEMRDGRTFEMGCVSWSQRFFPEGRFDRAVYDGAQAAAAAVLSPLAHEWRDRMEGGSFIGASGTIRATERVLRASGWTTHGVSRQGLQRTVKAIAKAGACTADVLPGLKRSRAPVFLGGLTVLQAIFTAFRIEHMTVAHGAMREGIVHDLVGWTATLDRRPHTLEMMAARHHVEERQAALVRELVLRLHADVEESWELRPESREALENAAKLHEIGLAISHRHHHLHAAYVLANTTMPGFSPRDRALLAAIVGAQRGRLDQAPFHRIEGIEGGTGSLFFESLAPFVGALIEDRPEEKQFALRLAILLRLASLLNRDRSGVMPDPIALRASNGRLELELPRAWLEERPLTREELNTEVQLLAQVGIELEIATPG